MYLPTWDCPNRDFLATYTSDLAALLRSVYRLLPLRLVKGLQCVEQQRTKKKTIDVLSSRLRLRTKAASAPPNERADANAVKSFHRCP